MGLAAELLRKGGTLVSQSCSICGGVQVKFSGKISCVNCGREEEISSSEQRKEGRSEVKDVQTTSASAIADLRNVIMTKLAELLPTLRSEKDPSKLAEYTNLIKDYLHILEKTSSEDKVAG